MQQDGDVVQLLAAFEILVLDLLPLRYLRCYAACMRRIWKANVVAVLSSNFLLYQFFPDTVTGVSSFFVGPRGPAICKNQELWSDPPILITSLDFPSSSPPRSTWCDWLCLVKQVFKIDSYLIDLHWFVTPGSPACVTSAGIGLVSLLSCLIQENSVKLWRRQQKKVWNWFKKHSPKRRMIFCDLIL